MRAELEAIRSDLREGKGEIRDLGTEVSEITQDLRALLHSELSLAKAETKEQAGYLVKVATWGGVALAAAIVMLAWVALTSTYALSGMFPMWLSALIVTVALGAVAGIAAFAAKSRAGKLSLVPRRTVNAVKEDVTWAKHQLKSNSTSSGNATH